MLVKVNSVALVGLEVVEVVVEVNIADRGFPGFDIVGLPTKSVAESKERVKTAILNSGVSFPEKRITVNLAPADLPKEGTLYDFPIAVGISSAIKGYSVPKDSVFFGELSLDGVLRYSKGSVQIGLYSKENAISNIYCPEDSANEAALIGGINVYKVPSLIDFIKHAEGKNNLLISNQLTMKKDEYPTEAHLDNDMSNIVGQTKAKRALEIAAAGSHNIILIGPPGVGKTALARAFSTILPPLDSKEVVEVTKIYSSVGMLDPNNPIIYNRPIRSPHHTISYAGLVGGGAFPKVGELSLAHKGVLFLDEFAEFPRHIIESLRQPMEDKKIVIARSKSTLSFPCEFTLFAASNPCPCGYLGHPRKQCICPDHQIKKYRSKISGPILDRIDLFVEVSPIDLDSLNRVNESSEYIEKSSHIRKRVIFARDIQLTRNNGITNSILKNDQIKTFCKLDQGSKNVLNLAAEKFNLSARSYLKIIKVSRTIADLANSDQIKHEHVAEALQYRNNFM